MKTLFYGIGMLTLSLMGISLRAQENPVPLSEVIVPQGKAQTLDGVLSPGEWDQVRRDTLPDGSAMMLMQDGHYLYVGLHTSSLAVSSICIDQNSVIAVLHSSAALGTARYKRNNTGWHLTQTFVWSCRNNPNIKQLQAERASFLAEEGWLASNALTGTAGEREYQITMPGGFLHLAVAYKRISDKTLLLWPTQLDDGCRNFDLIGGDAPDTLQFSPQQWITVRTSGTASMSEMLTTSPGRVPEVFARGIISTDHLEHSAPAFSPDGREIFWSLWRRPENGEPQVIMTVKREDEAWSTPRVAPFSGHYSDGGPVFSADGRRIYFYSLRPRPGEIKENKGDIWFVERLSRGDWSEPQCLSLAARFPELQFASQPSIARNGTIYFLGHTEGPTNGYGIYRSRRVNEQYAKPELLPRSINLPYFLNWTPFIAPDESYLLFSSNRRNPDTDGGDLYISRHQSGGDWTDPIALGEPVNMERQERFPMLSSDGKYLFFTRPTPGNDQDVYWIDTKTIRALNSTTAPLQEVK
jgi:hypothetical protein